jgi:SlyX protein
MTETEMLRARIDALETRVAHQERVIEELNAAITAQWKLTDGLASQFRRLDDRMQEVEHGAADASAPEPPPPHY